jgi:arginyl-tRNA--protein-N-Asp/Glu arginylyltransferase
MQATPSLFLTPAFYGSFRVEKLSPSLIDRFLGNGWFRNNVSLQTSTFRILENSFIACLNVRIPLASFVWKKRLRKLFDRNNDLFEVQMQPYVPSEEREALWQQYKRQKHGWVTVPDLHSFLFRDLPPEGFHTWELNVFHEGKLVAFSIFDLGQASLASLEAGYDLAYAKHSPGLYTMLLEIQLAISKGLSYYYSGFIAKDVLMFQYKLRPGGAEFFRLKSQSWVRWENLEKEDWLFTETLNRLFPIAKALVNNNTPARVALALYDNFPMGQIRLKDFNIALIAPSSLFTDKGDWLALTWEPVKDFYCLFRCSLETSFQPKQPDENRNWEWINAAEEKAIEGVFTNQNAAANGMLNIIGSLFPLQTQ